MIDDEEGKKGMWTSRKQFKKCAPCPFKVCTFFSHTKKKGRISTPQITKTEQKKPNKKKNCSNIQHHHKKEDDAFTRDRETFFSVLVSLSAYTHHETHRRRLASR
jgi:hypothetical protein